MKLPKVTNFISILVYLYLGIFIFLLSYTFYRAEIIYGGSQFSYYYKYYLLFIFGVIFWLIILLYEIKQKKQIVVLFTILVFLLYFYETLRFFAPTILKFNIIKSIIVKEPLNNNPNRESKLDVIEVLKKNKGIDVVPSIFPKALINKNLNQSDDNILPLGGVSNTTTVFCKEGKEFSIYKSDRYGFNNPDHEWDKNKIYWLLIGDSFVQGACVQPGEDFASQLRLLTNKNAISLGMSGNGPLIELGSLKEYGVKKQPNSILWFYFERNDLDDLRYEKFSEVLRNYLKEDFNQNLYMKQEEIDKKLRTHINLAEKELKNKQAINNEISEKFSSFKKIIRLQIIRDKTSFDRGLDIGVDPIFKEIITKANDTVSTWGGKLYFVYLPDKERYSGRKSKGENYLNKSQVIEMIKELKIPIIDIHEEFFIKKNDPLSFYADRIYGHYSSYGYLEISKTIIKKINNLSLNDN